MTYSSPVLSIIIVAYKSRGEIEACLGSLPRELGGVKIEVIVVDNSLNEDGTTTAIRENFAHVVAVNPGENLGFGRGNNLGFQKSSGENILFLNPDTVCNSEALSHCISRIRSENDIGLISPKLVLVDGSMDLACRRSVPTIWDGFCRATGLAAAFPDKALFAGYNLTHMPVDGTYEVGAINGAFMMGLRTTFENVGLFDENFFMYGDDLDLCIRIAKKGFRIVYDGSVQITHIKGVSVAKDFDRMSAAIFDANRDVYLKHFNPHGSTLVRWRYMAAFGLWKRIALFRAKLKRHRLVRPV